MIDLLRDPMIILVLYIIISHPKFQEFFGSYIPNLYNIEEGVSLTNLLVQGVLFISIYFSLKLFI